MADLFALLRIYLLTAIAANVAVMFAVLVFAWKTWSLRAWLCRKVK